ncbi:MAG TPA: YgiT-type zinc finger protein [Caldilineaceae bacterium]|nr:YgiT-type zinc finger protein [Caldilineaceae bacterium]
MTGERGNRRCPVCDGALASGEATIPYILEGDTVVVVKHVPAEIYRDCHEPFTSGKVTDQIVAMLRRLTSLQSEVSVVSYTEHELA